MSTITPRTCHDNDHEISQIQPDEHEDSKGNDTPLTRTKSIAETLSLPHEIAFVSTVCMAQFFARTPLSPFPTD